MKNKKKKTYFPKDIFTLTLLIFFSVAYKFGVIAMIAGIIGVPFGSMLAQKLRVRWHQADPLICAVGLLISAPLIFLGSVFASSNAIACYTLIFFGQLALNLNWSIVADMLLVSKKNVQLKRFKCP